MKCPYCGSYCADDTLYCPNCKQPLPTGEAAKKRERAARPKVHRPLWQHLITAAVALVSLCAFAVGGYKVWTWVYNYRLERLYTRGAYTPTISQVTLSDLRSGHSIAFFGSDGDQIFLPEMNQSLSISGGVTRLEIADADWFGPDIEGVDYADVTLSPMLISEVGIKTILPKVNFKIDVPQAPLTITSPAADRIPVVTSVYPLIVNVVPGSTVFVNGEDVTKSIDRSGLLSTNISVEPIGDNVVTLIVRTSRHRETRKEIVLERPKFDIALELDTTVSDHSSSRTMAITGKAEPGAFISVDTDYMEESLSVDMQTGRFSFIARFSTVGENVVRFRASMPGKKDASISFTVNYLPSLAEYSSKAWAMDYDRLRLMFEQWNGRVFQCRGELVDAFSDGNKSYVVMDVGGTREQQLIILENRSSAASPALGRRYTAYADVDGQYMYKSQYYPKLVARYMDLAT